MYCLIGRIILNFQLNTLIPIINYNLQSCIVTNWPIYKTLSCIIHCNFCIILIFGTLISPQTSPTNYNWFTYVCIYCWCTEAYFSLLSMFLYSMKHGQGSVSISDTLVTSCRVKQPTLLSDTPRHVSNANFMLIFFLHLLICIFLSSTSENEDIIYKRIYLNNLNRRIHVLHL